MVVVAMVAAVVREAIPICQWQESRQFVTGQGENIELTVLCAVLNTSGERRAASGELTGSSR